jgi:hypothetical protein
MGGSELAQFQIGPAHLTDDEIFNARVTVRAHVRDAGARREVLAMLGLDRPADVLPADHGTTARFDEGCLCVVCVGHQERIRGWAS